MSRHNTISIIRSREVKDYTYAILFFVVSSFFAFFVIRPVLSIALSLQKEAVELKTINETYEQNISRVLRLQADLESIRSKQHLLEKAVPPKIELDMVIDDIRRSAQEEGIQLQSLSIAPVDFKKIGPIQYGEPYTINAQVIIQGNFNEVNRFIHSIANQKRIKTIRSIFLNKALKASVEDKDALRIDMQIEVYYQYIKT